MKPVWAKYNEERMGEDIAGCVIQESPDAVNRVLRAAERQYADTKGSHDWDHTLRVIRLCRHIGPIEQADMTVLLIAAALHDIGRQHQDQSNGSICHAEKGAEMAIEIIQDLFLSDRQKENIIHSIRAHRFRGADKPETIEAKVLFDADKLDAIGAVGIARAYLFAGELGAMLHNPDHRIEGTRPYSKEDTGYREFMTKLRNVKDRVMTAEGRRMAENRHEFMVHFFNRFMDEYNGTI